VSVHRLTKEQARRIAIRAQLLEARRPTDLLELVGDLTFLQLDPTAAIAPSADPVAWTPLASSTPTTSGLLTSSAFRQAVHSRNYLRSGLPIAFSHLFS
jgi:uncharacterized protein YcaQ